MVTCGLPYSREGKWMNRLKQGTASNTTFGLSEQIKFMDFQGIQELKGQCHEQRKLKENLNILHMVSPKDIKWPINYLHRFQNQLIREKWNRRPLENSKNCYRQTLRFLFCLWSQTWCSQYCKISFPWIWIPPIQNNIPKVIGCPCHTYYVFALLVNSTNSLMGLMK